MKSIIISLLALSLSIVSCDSSLHEIPADKPTDCAVVTLTLTSKSNIEKEFNDVHLYWFNESDQLCQHNYYSSMEELALSHQLMNCVSYTILALLNVGPDFSLPTSKTSLENLKLEETSNFINNLVNRYPNLLTGTLRTFVKDGEQLFSINVENGTDGINEASSELYLTIPSMDMPPFVSSRASTPQLRATAHIFKKGSKELFATKRILLEPTTSPNVYKLGLSLFEGEFDVNLWVDYSINGTNDNHYITTHSDIIRILPKTDYWANDDYSDAFSKSLTVSVKNDSVTSQKVEMYRALAKYRIISTDVEQYKQMQAKKNLPDLKTLKVFIGYEGFFPSAYSISDQKPADAELGYSYNTQLGTPTYSDVEVAKDFVFVNGTESSVSVTILFKDSLENIVSGIKGVKIAYRAGELTTLKGNFLTSGLGSGVNIDTEWGEDINIEF